MLGLPDGVLACLFDMDGVVTQTATLHAAAWKEMFDEFLRGYAERTGTEFVPFDSHREYDAYVDGKPRLEGTRSFLSSRGIDLPFSANELGSRTAGSRCHGRFIASLMMTCSTAMQSARSQRAKRRRPARAPLHWHLSASG